jgi:hypothetical protein
MAEEYYNIGPEVNNIDFYIGGVLASSFIFVTSNTSASVLAIRQASATVAISSSVVTFAQKDSFASSSVSSAVSVDISAIEILNSLITSHATTTVTVSVSKIAKATSSITNSVTTLALANRITEDRANLSIAVSTNAIAIKQAPASSILLINSMMSASPSGIALGEVLISIINRTRVNQPIRFSPSFIDGSSIRTLLILDNKPLTNHNRDLDVQLAPSFIENFNWSNRKSRYYKTADSSGRKVFNITWKFLPNYMEKTVDNRHGRDFISSVSEDPDVHVLKVINQDQNGLTPYTETSYNVFVRSYSETLLRRDLSDGVYYFDCNLTLEEA